MQFYVRGYYNQISDKIQGSFMQQQETQSFLDFFRDRLTNPALFTYFWVLGVFHWKLIGWFLFEPLEFSLKLQRYKSLGFEINFINPLFITILVIIFSPLMNNAVEFIKRAWDQAFSWILKKINWKELVDAEDYNNLLNTNESLRSDKRGMQDQLDNQIGKLKQSEADLSSKIKVVADLGAEKNKLEAQNTTLKNELNQLQNESQETIKVTKEEIEKLKSKFELLSEEHKEIKSENDELKKDKQRLESQIISLMKSSSNYNQTDLFENKAAKTKPSQEQFYPIRGLEIDGNKIDVFDLNEKGMYPQKISLEKDVRYKVKLNIDSNKLEKGDSIRYFNGHTSLQINEGAEFVEFPFDKNEQSIILTVSGLSGLKNTIDKQRFTVNFTAK